MFKKCLLFYLSSAKKNLIHSSYYLSTGLETCKQIRQTLIFGLPLTLLLFTKVKGFKMDSFIHVKTLLSMSYIAFEYLLAFELLFSWL